jgi:hypothetical protein
MAGLSFLLVARSAGVSLGLLQSLFFVPCSTTAAFGGRPRRRGLPSGPASFLFFLPRNDASDRFQLGRLRAFANIFAANFLPARILRALVVLGAADKSISSRSIIDSVFSRSVRRCRGALFVWIPQGRPRKKKPRRHCTLLFNARHHLRALDAAAVGPKTDSLRHFTGKEAQWAERAGTSPCRAFGNACPLLPRMQGSSIPLRGCEPQKPGPISTWDNHKRGRPL